MGTKDLAGILTKRDPEKYKSIIERAALNGYHDHKFDSIPGHSEYGECICPKIQLVNDLSPFPELKDIIAEVMDGVYDEPADETDQAEMRGWLMDENSPDEMFRQLGFKVPTSDERKNWHKQKELN